MAKSQTGGHSERPPYKPGEFQTYVPDNPRPSGFSRFELLRDNERDLHFDGEELFSIESAGSPTLHRAAIYRTRAGKFVAEFSSRPTPQDERLGKPADEHLKELAGNLWERVEDFIDDNSHSPRHEETAERLAGMPNALRDLRIQDSRWIRLWRLRETVGATLADEAEERFVRDYRSSDGNGETAWQFLDALIAAIARHARVSTTISSKVDVFDTLDDAFAWFRPGRLTNELLKQAGRWGPEFID